MRRRQVLAGGAAMAAGLVATAACGGGTGGPDATAGGGASDPADGGTSGGKAGSPPTGAGGGLVDVADVPVGGAVSATDPQGRPLIISQPKRGDVVAFSAICTHQGCTVAPDGAQLRCPCHGSVYQASDGSNVSGPAPAPLPPVTVKVVGGRVVEA